MINLEHAEADTTITGDVDESEGVKTIDIM